MTFIDNNSNRKQVKNKREKSNCIASNQEGKNWPAHLLKFKHADFFWAVFIVLNKLRDIT